MDVEIRAIMGTRGVHLTEEVRLLIARMWERGHEAEHIAVACDVSRSTVMKWARRWEAEGEAGLVDRPVKPGVRQGRPKLPESVQAEMVRLAKEHPEWSYARIARTITPLRYPDLQRGVAAGTVEKYLKAAGLGRSRWGDEDD